VIHSFADPAHFWHNPVTNTSMPAWRYPLGRVIEGGMTFDKQAVCPHSVQWKWA
jgi:hypothetical protein